MFMIVGEWGLMFAKTVDVNRTILVEKLKTIADNIVCGRHILKAGFSI